MTTTVMPSLGERLRDRREGALEEVYEEFSRTTFGYFLSTVRDRGAAEDLQQELYLEVWRRARKYDPQRGALAAWIMTIARSRAIDYLRKKTPEPSDPTAGPEIVDPRADAEGEQAVQSWLVGRQLDKLPDRERALLKMRFHGGMSQSQIATASGIPVGTVKMHMASGMRRLRDLMDEQAP
jgi:RNA polymerase sigma-70 factor (ECF subfamily)